MERYEWSDKLCESYGRILTRCKGIHDNALEAHRGDRKAIAQFFLDPNRKMYSKVCFTMLDGKDPSKAAWALVKEEYKDELSRPVMGDPYDDEVPEEAVCQS